MSRIAGTMTLENLRVTGTLETVGTVSGIDRTELTQESLTPFLLPPESWRVHDNMDALCPDPPVDGVANDDLGIVSGTYGTGTPSLQTGDVKAGGAVTKYARRCVQLPYNYIAGETVVIRLHAGMVTTVADTTATCDVQAYKSDNEGGVDGGDLCATAATSCNSLTDADKDFTITATSLAPGDVLDVRVAMAINDGASGTAVKGILGRIELLCDTKG